MTASTDVAILGFYFAAFLMNLAITSQQILHPGKDESLSATALRVMIRIGLGVLFYMPVIYVCGRLVGWQLSQRSGTRRQMILSRVESDERDNASETAPGCISGKEEPIIDGGDGKAREPGHPANWTGIIGFFHPFCNAGGGGERVLWAAIRATQNRCPNAICVVYTGDHDATKSEIIARVKTRFNIQLNSSKVFFLYLSTRKYVLASTWPRFTLFGQSLGSLILAIDAFNLLVPDIFIDTMGYAFALGIAKLCFPQMPTAAYVHYPTISKDMLESLVAKSGKGVNAGAGRGWRGIAKLQYWHWFAMAYSWVGGTVDVVMTNSSWTQGHIRSLWGENRTKNGKTSDIEVVFPPVAVEEITEAVQIGEDSEAQRKNTLVYIAQFRPEKNHTLIMEAFGELLHSDPKSEHGDFKDSRLVLIGSVRDSSDSKRVYGLRLLANELKIKDEVEFVRDASWPDILQWLRKSSVGVNGMWNEHFGIGVVEYQAAGLISVVNNSGGPKHDIVIDFEGDPTGFHASSVAEYAAAFRKALSQSPQDKLAMRRRARLSSKRFSEAEFNRHWTSQLGKLIAMHMLPDTVSIFGNGNRTISASYIAILAYDYFKLKG